MKIFEIRVDQEYEETYIKYYIKEGKEHFSTVGESDILEIFF
jgi:hypothetical protein